MRKLATISMALAFLVASRGTTQELEPAASDVVELAAQQAPAGPPPATPSTDLSRQFSAAGAASSTATRRQSATSRLAQAPEMFGDSIAMGTVLSSAIVENEMGEIGTVSSSLQFPVGGFGLKVSDNNSPLPRDRVYYRFSSYDDLISTTPRVDFPSTVQQFNASQSLPIHTIGLEKTFLDGRASVEVRAPFARRVEFEDSFVSSDGTSSVGSAYATAGEGNMSVITKAVIGMDDELVWGGGLAVEAPTGRDTFFDLDFTRGEYRNKAVYLYPYLAALWTPESRLFHQAFLGVNVPLNDDELVIYDPLTLDLVESFRTPIELATTLSIDLSTGYWLCRDRSDRWVTDLALIGEVHYTGSLGSPNVATPDSGLFFSDVTAGAASVDYVNLTGGVHIQLGPKFSLRFSAVTPLADRPFDSEITAQATYWY